MRKGQATGPFLMMPKIIVTDRFDHCAKGAVYPTAFRPGYEPIDVDEETAKIAIDNGWARLAKGEAALKDEKKPPATGEQSGAQTTESDQSGKGEQSSASDQGQASTAETSNTSGKPKKSKTKS